MKYIDADKLKKLIDEKWKELADKNVKVGGGKWDAEISTYLSVLNLIDSLHQEQPEADLDREIIKYKVPFTDDREYLNETTLDAIARYFAEWGAINLSAKKEESK